ncbi:MAG: hypothetical protein QW165_00830 [Candidatus Woesearchaeota archaeon]
MRHVPVSILAIVAIVGVTILMLSVQLYPETVIWAITYVPGPSAPASGDTVIVDLSIGEYISNEIPALSETSLRALSRGNVYAKDVSTDYTQSLTFAQPGLFLGGHVEFGRDEQNRVADFLKFDAGQGMFKYQVDFGAGLRSTLDGIKMVDIIDEDMKLLGNTFSIVDADYNTGSNRVELRLFGGFGSIDIMDGNSADDNFQSNGIKINGKTVPSLVKVKATMSGGKPTIYSIQYIPLAEAVQGGDVYVAPMHCLRQYLRNPTAMLVPEFDICYKGLTAPAAGIPAGGISGNEVRFRTVGGDEMQVTAPNARGQIYKIPLAQLPGMYGNKGRNFVFVEAPAPGAPNINLQDYFLVMSKDDVNGVSNVLQYDAIDTTNNRIIVKDLAGGTREATFDPGTGEGQLLVGEGTYRFVVGAGNALAMDQTNNGAIAGNEAKFILIGGSKLDFGPGFTVKVITPSRLFDEPMGDETTDIVLTFGGYAGLTVPSPQVTVPGYTFKLQSPESGIKQGLTKWGILFTWDHNGNSDDLDLTVPGSRAAPVRGGAQGNVYITFDTKLKKPVPQVPAMPSKCGDALITKPEYCDPPGSPCADQFRRPGTCAADCMSCEFKSPAVCGNRLLEQGEDCEATADCLAGFFCEGCRCKPIPPAVCGNNLLETGEQCEVAADCGPGYACINCGCAPLPPVMETPAPAPNIFARFFAWLARLFGA